MEQGAASTEGSLEGRPAGHRWSEGLWSGREWCAQKPPPPLQDTAGATTEISREKHMSYGCIREYRALGTENGNLGFGLLQLLVNEPGK